ncbi:hypothetical protein G9A89_013344 [Geosiphon pyriformis]|nr:hypothetical protein G9A89_013344 [Geosiphon pyriformis]
MSTKSSTTNNGEGSKRSSNASIDENKVAQAVDLSTPTRKKTEGSTGSPSEQLEFTTSPVPLTPKDKTNYQEFNTTISPSSSVVESSVSTSEQEKTLVHSKRTDYPYFQIGISEDKNKRCRRTMEDAHSFFEDFGGVEGQGFFAIFDGHAGKQAAEWCGEHFHETFQQVLQQYPGLTVPEVFAKAFHEADKELKQNAGKHSGCTAITAFLRTEEVKDGEVINGKENDVRLGTAEIKKKSKRVLYTANVGDARAVLCHDGKAIRLSYDHKGSDAQEAKRIVDAGGFVMNNRVNADILKIMETYPKMVEKGVLAVTRSLGDSSMKEFIVGSPYTTETIITEKDPFLILACDGLWDVCEDQDAVDLIKDTIDPQRASEELLQHALKNFSTDNLSVMVVRLTNSIWQAKGSERGLNQQHLIYVGKDELNSEITKNSKIGAAHALATCDQPLEATEKSAFTASSLKKQVRNKYTLSCQAKALETTYTHTYTKVIFAHNIQA